MSRLVILFLILISSSLLGAISNEKLKEPNYLYDDHHVRYELYQTNTGEAYNWLFLPGGPGADSRYLRSLVKELKLPGNVWLIDLPGNGDNAVNKESYDFNEWVAIFPNIIKRFSNPILVGHSFGGMFPLLFPELENYLKGFVILNSSPKLWLEEAASYAKQFDLPDLTHAMQEFTQNPNSETFKIALDACLPYYFPKDTLEKGRKLLAEVPFEYVPAGWWQKKVIDLNFSAKWIPHKVPTLIIGSKYDCVCPHTLFKNDERFQKRNVRLIYIEDAGHMGWVENPRAFRNVFNQFINNLK